MSLQQIAGWLEETSIALWVKESQYGFAIVVAVHILSLMLSVGMLVWFDLRLLGVSMLRIPVSRLYRRLMPWILTGFALMFCSGGILLAAYATAALGNIYFQLKVVAMLLAGVNAVLYHRYTERHIARWDEALRPPRAARAAGLISIVLWASVILAGRAMSYTIF
jgi:hypothetical protein